jgi:transcriptional regulator with XRE-family HTH domain
VIDMELLSVIRRWRYRDHFSIREISRRTGLSRNTVRKYLRSDSVEPKFAVPDRPSRLDPYADKLSHMLRQEAGKSRKQKRTVKQLHADLVALGYTVYVGLREDKLTEELRRGLISASAERGRLWGSATDLDLANVRAGLTKQERVLPTAL